MAAIGETTIEISPFHVEFSDEALEDLRPPHRRGQAGLL